MCKASWVIYSSGQIVARIVTTLYRDRKSRETKTASFFNRAHLIMMNVLYRSKMYLGVLDRAKSGTTVVVILHSIGIIIFERT